MRGLLRGHLHPEWGDLLLPERVLGGVSEETSPAQFDHGDWASGGGDAEEASGLEVWTSSAAENQDQNSGGGESEGEVTIGEKVLPE